MLLDLTQEHLKPLQSHLREEALPQIVQHLIAKNNPLLEVAVVHVKVVYMIGVIMGLNAVIVHGMILGLTVLH